MVATSTENLFMRVFKRQYVAVSRLPRPTDFLLSALLEKGLRQNCL